MERVPRPKYMKEFWEQAVRMVREQNLTIPEAARHLSMSEKTLANLVFRARQGQLARVDQTRQPVTELDAEVSRLKRELAEARMERNILKKPPRTLRRRSCSVRTDDNAAPPISAGPAVSDPRDVPKRVPCLAYPPRFEVHPGERTVGSGHSGRACAHGSDVWSGTAASRIA